MYDGVVILVTLNGAYSFVFLNLDRLLTKVDFVLFAFMVKGII